MKTRQTMIALLTALALAPACGSLPGPSPVDTIAYLPDGSLVAFMPTGMHVFGASLDRETRTILFDGLPVTTIEANRYSLSADGRVAAVSFPAPFASMDRSTIALFDMTTGTRLKTLRPDDASLDGHIQGVTELMLSPDADLVFSRSIDWSSGAEVKHSTMFDTATGSPLWTRDDRWQLPVFSRDGSLLFVENWMSLRLDALDPRTGEIVYSVDLPSRLSSLAATPDGNLVGMVGPPDYSQCPEPGSCPPSYAVWSQADGALLAEWPGIPETNTHGTNPNGLAAFWCSPWDNLCATGLVDFSNHVQQQPPVLNIWRTDGTPVRTLAPYADAAANVVAFSPDSQLIAVASFAGTSVPVRVFRIADGKLMGALNFHWDFL